MQVFAGSSNRELASEIASLLETQLGEIEISQFANGETRVWVKEGKVEHRVVVVQSLSSPTNEHLVELCLIVDALRRVGASEITAVIPWMGYSKQDKIFRPGEPLSAKVVAQILQSAQIDKIITIDLHNRATLGFFDLPIRELSARPILMEYFKKKVGTKTLVVAPDEGAVKASTELARELGVPIVYVDKKRDLTTGEVSVVGMSRSVAGGDLIVTDDNVFTGSTLLQVAKELKEAGAKTIRVGLTHHLYVPHVQEKLEDSEIDEIVVTNTVSERGQVRGKKSSKLKIVSVAQMIVDELG
ncbi:MAG: Ribose-phosphate pyrophosphokinase [Microgenomates group bacterium GW2011_GWA2_46_7]|nr:MAG: Ribose-phosphate pyrophosphokinase [Microgenomates group bacterium GW2011_GWA2_46_7]KKU46283.1 MAG: Ribose-phosphate pyrophosphokinase [Microgenomates group bacterium GW2011_GWC2_46_7]